MIPLTTSPPASPPAPTGAARPPVDRIQGTRRIVEVMGTMFTLDVRDLDPAAAAVDEVVAWWQWVDDTFSTYRSDSQITRLADGSLLLDECAPEVRHVLGLCQQAATASGGYFTDHPGGRLDPSGMVKGWSVEVASNLLLRAGSEHHCITAGGDVQCVGVPGPGDAWRIGIVDPADRHRLLAVVSPSAQPARLAVATSGTAERGPHIVDPLAGTAASELASITVVGTDLTLVDWAATAAFAMGHDSRLWLDGLDGVDAYAVTPDGEYWCTDGFESLAQLLTDPLGR